MIGTKVPQVSDINELAQTIIAVEKVIKTKLIGHKRNDTEAGNEE